MQDHLAVQRIEKPAAVEQDDGVVAANIATDDGASCIE